MRFNIRAISKAEPASASARVDVTSVIGATFSFTAGISAKILLPDTEAGFANLHDPCRTLCALNDWCRVYIGPAENGKRIHVLASAENPSGGSPLFYRIDLIQVSSRRRHRGPAQLLGDSVMTRDGCANWLVDLAHQWGLRPNESAQQTVIVRPSTFKPEKVRIAWVGPELVENVVMSDRLKAIGLVFGAEIVHVRPSGYKDTKAALSGALPLDAIVVGRHYSPLVTEHAIPEAVDPRYLLFCESIAPEGLEEQVRTWIEVTAEQVIRDRLDRAADENVILLGLMLKGMLSHSKIGQYSHCDRTEVLTAVVAKGMNVARAEAILDENSERFRETATSEKLFLWKTHNDGDQYFLNPSKVSHVKQLVGIE